MEVHFGYVGIFYGQLKVGWGGGGWGEEVYLCGWDGLTFMGGWKWVG